MLSLPGYEIAELVRVDKGARCFRGRRKSDGLAVVVKIAEAEPADAEGAALVEHEFAVLNRLNGEGAPRAYGLERYGRMPVLVMEDCPGQAVSAMTVSGEAPLGVFLTVGAAMAEALGRVHARGVLVRGVTAESAVFDERSRRVAFTDFSRAAFPESDEKTESLPRVSSLPHLAPEMSGRMGVAADYRADLYALGVTFYKLLTGRYPFADADPLAVTHAHLAKTPEPPQAFAADVPHVVSRIVLKLLAKDPGARYQGAWGLKADLDACLRLLGDSGRLPDFAIGRHDLQGMLRLPEDNYGRDAERAVLRDAARRLAQGARELVLVSGYSGIGKTSLVMELGQRVATMGATFVSGKFAASRGNQPYCALTEALGRLCRRLLSEPEPGPARWKRAVRAAVGDLGRLLVELVPEMEGLVGPQPVVPEVQPLAAKIRLNRTLSAFIRAVCRQDRPLAIFLDDLQWADDVTLEFLRDILNDAEVHHFLCLGAYRDNEVGAGHPLARTVEALQASRAALTQVPLGAIAYASTCRMLGDTLGADETAVRELADILHCQTWGNPFFLRQALTHLHATGYLTFDAGQDRWVFDIDAIAAMGMAENVADLLTHRLGRLPPGAAGLLGLGACMGGVFDLGMAAAVAGSTPEAVLYALHPALEAGLVYLPPRADAADSGAPGPDRGEQRVAFTHDRILESVLAGLTDDERTAGHYAIARAFLAASADEEREQRVYEVADHLNLAVPLLASATERLRAARHNLKACLKARQAAAFPAALAYARKGMDLLPQDPWTAEYALTLALYKERGLLEHLNLNYEEAEAFYVAGMERAASPVDRCDFIGMRIYQWAMTGRIQDVAQEAKRVLPLYGIAMPDDDILGAVERECETIAAIMAGKPPSAYEDMPVMTDPVLKAACRLVNAVGPTMYFCDQNMLHYLGAVVARLTLEHGYTDGSSPALASHGRLLITRTGDYDLGYEFGKLALHLCHKHDSVGTLAVTITIIVDTTYWYQQNKNAIFDLLKQAMRSANICGDLYHVDFIQALVFTFHFLYGNNLLQSMEDIKRLYFKKDKVVSIIGQYLSLAYYYGLNSLVRADSEEEDAFVEAAHKLSQYASLAHMYALKAISHYILGNLDEVQACFEKSKHYSITHGLIIGCDLMVFKVFFAAAKGAQWLRLNEEAAREVESTLGLLRYWSGICPETFRARCLLLEAEMARVNGQPLDTVVDLYDRAIVSAKDSGLIHMAALGEELSGKYWLSRGKRDFARVHLANAMEAYRAWGAEMKVEAIRLAHADLWESRTPESGPPPGERGSGEIAGDAIDLLSLMKAARAISGEILLPNLTRTLARLAVENAGAQRCVLALHRDGCLAVVDTEHPESPEIPLEDYPNAPASMLRWVAHNKTPLVLDDARSDDAFGSDPYAARVGARSVLCAPIVRRDNLAGIIFLENNLVSGAFTPKRVETVTILAAQAAISLENAYLYADLRQAEREVVQLNGKLLRIQEEERLRISLDLHDDVAQDLLAANLHVQALLNARRAAAPRDNEDRRRELNAVLKGAIAKVRDLSHALRPPDLETLGLSRSLELLCVDMTERTGLRIEYADQGLDSAAMDYETQVHLYRIAQEALGNAVKHARAGRAVLRLTVVGPATRLSVEDDGKGFDPSAPEVQRARGRRMGLSSMKERARLVGGRLRVDSRPGDGTRVTFELIDPRKRHAQDQPHTAC